MSRHIVIAGGGFGGLAVARTLERILPPHSARVTLVSDSNFLLYTPLLPGAAGASCELRHVVVPLRHELKRTELRVARVIGGDPERNCLRLRCDDGIESDLAYDQLVLEMGSVSRTLPIPGLVEHAIGLKTLPEAFLLRNRVIRMLELAEMQDYAASVLDLYPRCRAHGTRWVLVEARDRLMPEISD
jgi:NADH dehydrogenase